MGHSREKNLYYYCDLFSMESQASICFIGGIFLSSILRCNILKTGVILWVQIIMELDIPNHLLKAGFVMSRNSLNGINIQCIYIRLTDELQRLDIQLQV